MPHILHRGKCSLFSISIIFPLTRKEYHYKYSVIVLEKEHHTITFISGWEVPTQPDGAGAVSVLAVVVDLFRFLMCLGVCNQSFISNG